MAQNFTKEVREKLLVIKKSNKDTTNTINKTIETVKSIDSLFNDVPKQFDFFTHTLENDYNKHLKNINKEDELYNFNISNEKNILNDGIEQVNRQYEEQINEFRVNTNLRLNDLNNQIAILNDNKDEHLKEIALETQRNKKKIEKKQEEVKVESSKQIKENDDYYQKIVKKINSETKEETAINNKLLEETMVIINEKLDQYKQIAAENKKTNDENYFKIRQVYQLASKNFNKQIDKLKNAHDKVLKELEEIYQKNIQPFNDEKIDLEEYVLTVKNGTIEEYQAKVDKLANDLELLKVNFENTREKIYRETNEEITILNSKLTSLKESVQIDKDILNDELSQQIKSANSNEEINKLKIKYNSKIHKINQELNRQIVNNSNAIFKKQKRQYQRLKAAETDFIKKRMSWRIEQQTTDLEFRQSQDVINSYNDFKSKEINSNLKLEKNRLLNERRKAENIHLLEIAPLQSQLNIAGLIQERDIKTLNNESSIAKYLNDISIEETNLKQMVDQLNTEKSNLLIKEKHELNFKKATITNQLAISQIIKTRDLRIALHKLEERSFNLANNITTAEKLVKYEIDNVRLDLKKNFEHEKLLVNTRYAKDILELNLNIISQHHNLNVERFELVLNNSLTAIENKLFDNDIDALHKLIVSLITYVNDVATNLSIFLEHFNEMFQIPSQPDDNKLFLDNLNLLLENILLVTIDLIDQFDNKIEEYVERKIASLNNYNYETMFNNLKAKHNHKKRYVEEQISELKDNKNNTSDHLYVLENRLANINNEKKVLNKQVHSFMHDTKLKENLNSLTRRINETNKEIRKYENILTSLSRKENRLINTLSSIDKKYEKNISKISIVRKRQNAFFFEWQEHFNYYTNKLKSVSRIFINRFIKANNEVRKTTYLTTNTINAFINQIKKSTNSSQNNVVLIFQQMLNLTLGLYQRLTNKTKTLQQRSQARSKLLIRRLEKRIRHENTILVSTNNKKEKSIELLLSAYKNSFETSKKAIIKHNEQRISALKQSQAITDNSILNHKQLVADETKLIVDNLNQSIKNYEEQYKKEVNSINKYYHSKISKIKLQKNKLINNLKETNASLEMTNKQLSDQYNTNHNKQLVQLKNQQQYFKNKHKDLLKAFEKEVNANRKYLKQLQRNHKNNIVSHRKELKKKINNIIKSNHVEAHKELKDMQKSINFKLRTLKLK